MKIEYLHHKNTHDLIVLASELSEIYDQIKQYESLDVDNDSEYKDEYEEFLDGCYESVTFNNTTYCYSEVLKSLEEWRYDQGFSEWVELTYLEPLDESLNEKYNALRTLIKDMQSNDPTTIPHLWDCVSYLNPDKTLTWYRCNLRYLLKELNCYINFLKDKYQIED